MKFAKKMSLALSLAAAIAGSAQAQDAKVKVMLPHDVQIGEAVIASRPVHHRADDGRSRHRHDRARRSQGRGRVRTAHQHRRVRHLQAIVGEHAARRGRLERPFHLLCRAADRA